MAGLTVDAAVPSGILEQAAGLFVLMPIDVMAIVATRLAHPRLPSRRGDGQHCRLGVLRSTRVTIGADHAVTGMNIAQALGHRPGMAGVADVSARHRVLARTREPRKVSRVAAREIRRYATRRASWAGRVAFLFSRQVGRRSLLANSLRHRPVCRRTQLPILAAQHSPPKSTKRLTTLPPGATRIAASTSREPQRPSSCIAYQDCCIVAWAEFPTAFHAPYLLAN